MLFRSVSALKTRTARYFSGSRAALTGVASAEGLAIATVGDVLALTVEFVFVFVSDRWQALPATPSKLISKREVTRTGVKNLDPVRAARRVSYAAVFINFSEEFERRLS